MSADSLFGDVDISEEDVYAAMQCINGYIDISTGDFVALYRLPSDRARQRLLGRIRANDLMHNILVPLTQNLMLDEAARLMANQGVVHIPVVNDRDQVVGILAESDVVRHLGAETVLGLLQRYGVIEDEIDLSNLEVLGPLPEPLLDQNARAAKLLRDQKKLYALVQYVQSEDRRQFIRDYFGVA